MRRGSMPSHNILIVDDDHFMRTMIREILTSEGFAVAGEAEDGEEAVKLYRELRPDLTTMDIVMPKMDGIAALNAILELDSAAKVIMISSLGQEALIAEAIETGAKDFIVKPFQRDRILKVARYVLGLDKGPKEEAKGQWTSPSI